MKTLVIKQTLLTCLLFLSCTGLQAQERIVEQPAFDAWSSTTLEIDKIALSDTATVFYIDAYFRPKRKQPYGPTAKPIRSRQATVLP